MRGSGYSKKFLYGYGAGEFGFTFFLFFIAYYLMYYMTDVLRIPTATAAVIYTVLQWFEGISMVGAGILVDRLRLPGGAYRPWMIVGAVLCAVGFVIFFCDFQLPPAGNIAVFVIFYFLAYIGYNLMWVGYRSLVGPISRNSADNVALTAASSQLGSAAGLVFSYCGEKLLRPFPDIRTGYMVSAVVYAVIMVAGILISARVTRKYDNGKTERRAAGKKAGLKEFLRSVNQPMVVFFLAVTFREAISTMFPTLIIYYFKHVAGNEGWISVYLTVMTVTALIGYSFARGFAGRFGKKRMFLASSVVSAACILAINFIGADMRIFMVLMAIHSFCSIFSGAMIPAFMNEIADYNEYTKGVHTRGFIISLGGGAIRCAAVLGGALSGFGLAAIGYKNGAAPPPGFGTNLTLLMTLGAAGGILLGALILTFYKLDDKVMKKIYESREQA